MIKFIKNISNIGLVKIIDNSIFLCYRNGKLFFNENLLVTNVESQSFWKKNDILYYHNMEGEHCFYDFNTSKIIKGKNGIAWFTIENNLAFCSYDLNRGNDRWHWKSGILDLNSQIITKEYPSAKDMSLCAMSDNSYILFQNIQTLCSISKTDGKTIWQSQIPKLGYWEDPLTKLHYDYKIGHIIGVISNILWIDIKQGMLLGIDIVTGEAKHIIKMPSPPSPQYEEGLYGALFHRDNTTVYDPKINKLVCLNTYHYYEVDLNKDEPTLEFRLLKNEFMTYQVLATHSSRRCMDDDYIYFLDTDNTAIVALNRVTFKIDWVYRFTGAEADEVGVLMTIEVMSNKLYVLDHLGHLFIFEKDEDTKLNS